MGNLIEPRILKGFRDFLPSQERERRRIELTLIETFEGFGFVPIDTPALEYSEVLLGKGGGETDKQVYRFRDHGDRDVALRYDLTVPFARFMAAHSAELYLPFRRYHVAKVWRGENTQRGRYREFTQCDFDIVGVDSASADFEILTLMRESFRALGVARVKIKLSHRGVFNRFLERIGVAGLSADILRIVDKTPKIGEAAVRELLIEVASPEVADQVQDFVRADRGYAATAAKMERLAGGPSDDTRRLAEIADMMEQTGTSSSFELDPSITRGLDYYTGIVYETFLEQLPEIGSVCSGGRYNDLASMYSKLALPGVGASIGLDRLTAALEEIGGSVSRAAETQVLVMFLDERLLGHYHALASRVRAAGLVCEVYPERKKLAAQFSFAEKKGIRFALICGEDEQATGTVSLKDLVSRESTDRVPFEQALERIAASARR